MTWHRRQQAWAWLAMILVAAFVACGGLAVRGSSAGAIGRAAMTATGAQSVSLAPAAIGAVDVAAALGGSAAANGASTSHRSDADTAAGSSLRRLVISRLVTSWTSTSASAGQRASALSRAPPLT